MYTSNVEIINTYNDINICLQLTQIQQNINLKTCVMFINQFSEIHLCSNIGTYNNPKIGYEHAYNKQKF